MEGHSRLKGTRLLRKIIWQLAAVAMLVSAPAAAQDASEQDPFAALAQAFPAEPLTAEQEARLPQARAIIEKIVPPGSIQDVMGTMFDNLFKPLMTATSAPTSEDAAELLGLDAAELHLGEGQAAEIVRIIDPAHEERAARTAAAMPEAMNRMMTAAEPVMRQALSEIYAVYFDEPELTDIGAFFDTPSGIAYARKSMSMASDPRYLGAMMRSMPDMMAGMREMEGALAAAIADLPMAKGYADLTAEERVRLAELTGLDAATIQSAMDLASVADDEVPEGK